MKEKASGLIFGLIMMLNLHVIKLQVLREGGNFPLSPYWMKPCLLAHCPLLSLAYPMITHTPLIAGSLPIKTLVAR